MPVIIEVIRNGFNLIFFVIDNDVHGLFFDSFLQHAPGGRDSLLFCFSLFY